jgi:hypothetical protein
MGGTACSLLLALGVLAAVRGGDPSSPAAAAAHGA